MGRMIIKWYLILLLVGLACIPIVSAVTIDISPHQVLPRDAITVTVNGLKDGSEVTIYLEATINNPGPIYYFEIKDMFFPINIDEAEYTITNENTATNTVSIINDIPSYGKTFITIGGNSVNDRWSGEISGEGRHDINGTFNLIRMNGLTKFGGASKIISTMKWEKGVKRASLDHVPPGQVNGGPDDFMISFSQNGIKSGSIEITILVDGTEVVSETVIIESPTVESTRVSTVATKGSTIKGTVKNTRANIISTSVPMTVKLSAINSETGNASSMFSKFMINQSPAYMRNFALLK